MRIGISPFATTRETTLELSRIAVEGGLDTLWLGDGYLANPDFTGWAGAMESLAELAWLAGRYPTARVGIAAAILPLRDPSWLAKQANTLHRMAGGGFVLVVTPGFWAHDLEARGIAFDDRAKVFDAGLADLRRLLLDETLSPGPAQAPARRRCGWPGRLRPWPEPRRWVCPSCPRGPPPTNWAPSPGGSSTRAGSSSPTGPGSNTANTM